MKKIIALVLFIYAACLNTQAQEVLWADKVLQYSSQFGEKQYSAQQILGKPNVLPNLGLSPSAWTPKRKGKDEFIKIGFQTPLQIQQVAIAETHNPGSIKKIYAFDPEGNQHLISELEPKFIPIEGRLFRLFIEKTEFEVAALKIEFDGTVIDDHIGVDAVAISDSREPITVDINISDEINNDYIPIALDSNVNTIYNELKPLISPDGSTLFFSRQNHPENTGGVNDDEDIWMSKRDTTTGEWTKAINIGFPLNNDGPNFINSITEDEDGNTTIVLLGNAYYSKNKMTQGVSMSSKGPSGEWAKPTNLQIRDDYNYSDKANYFLSSDQETMVMAVEREDTYGSRDLYVSFKRNDGSWAKPLNMGNIINSADEESSPFLASDGKTLFFSSKGFSGFGGYDIYLTRRLDDSWTNWSEPENLGAAFNSREDDVFFNFTENDEYAYFTRGTHENTDIYKVKLPYYQKPQMLASLMGDDYQNPSIIVAVKGKVYDSKTLEKIPGTIEYFRTPDELELVEITNADTTNGYRVILKEDFTYHFKTKSPGYYSKKDSVDLHGITESIEIEKDIYLDPIIKDKPIVLDNVNFDFDKSDIRKDAEPVLDKLVEMMNDNPDLLLSIEGHTCSMGPEYYNQGLSERRAKSVVDYINNHGVDKKRLDYIGYGELRPKASNETKEGREENRRVEFRVKDSEGNTEISSETTANMR